MEQWKNKKYIPKKEKGGKKKSEKNSISPNKTKSSLLTMSACPSVASVPESALGSPSTGDLRRPNIR